MSDQHPRGRSKSRSKSKSRKNSADAGDKKSETVTTINSEKTITQNAHKSKEGNSKEPNCKQMTTEEMEKEVQRRRQQSAEQSAKQKQINAFAEFKIQESILELLKSSSKLKNAYEKKKQEAQEKWNETKEIADYEALDEEHKQKLDKECKRNYNKHINQVFIDYWVFSQILSKKKAQKLAHDHFKENADPHAAHAHVHASLPTEHGDHAHKDAKIISAGSKPLESGAQMSYDNALWGAATHTRAGDSLRYL